MTDTSELSKLAKLLGKRGGNATKAKYGTKHFSTAGKLGMARRWAKKRAEQAKQEDNAGAQNEQKPKR